MNAWLAPPRDLDGLTHGLARLLDDAELRARLRAGALATAQARQWDAIFDRLEADYRAAMLAGARGKVQAA